LTIIFPLNNIATNTGGSSSGRTTGSGPVNRGSNPRPSAIFIFQLPNPTPSLK
jgi:hypothetical protein